jgi:NAD(P)-dependent dehydrogenase (short-subunit alcohol dehydrogenase family)
MEIAGKGVIVTGVGGDGCGRAIARRFARVGGCVIVSGIDEAQGREAVRLIQRDGGEAAFVRCDVRDRSDARNLVTFAEETFGGLAVLVNNASGPVFDPGAPLGHWAEIVETDLLGATSVTRFAIDAMRRNGEGAIVNMGSVSSLGHGGNSGVPAYDAAKAGLMRLTTALAPVLRPERIRVNCLAPGWIASEPVRAYWESLSPEQRRDRGAPSRLLQLDEVAAAVAWLATDESLSGRILVWWSEDSPRLIASDDRGYASSEETPAFAGSVWGAANERAL